MKNLFIFLFLFSSFQVHGTTYGMRVKTDRVETKDQVIHIQEIYKTIDTFNLKIDVFYNIQSFEKENNTAIVFFHGGGWAYGAPDEFFTT
jgi:alpha-L-fucosidase 2